MPNTKQNSPTTQDASSSSLFRALLLGALVLIVFEIGSISILVANILETEHLAAHEYKLIKASEELSIVADLMRQHRRVADDWILEEHTDEKRKRHEQSVKKVEDRLKALADRWREAGQNTDDLVPLTEGYQTVMADTSNCLNCSNEKQIEKLYKLSIMHTKELYPRARVLMDQINESMEKEDSRNKKKRKQSPLPILIIASISNFILALLAVFWIDRKIAMPIAKLSNECKELAKGEAIAAPASLKSDVDSLRLVFHKMSADIAATEQNRKGYLRLLKAMQSQSLERTNASMNALFQSDSVTEQGKKKLRQITLNLDSMSQLLESMREGLSFNEHEQLKVNYAEMDTSTLAETAELAVGAMLQQKKIRLNSNCEALKIEADLHLLSRVVINLLSNACKFSPQNSEIDFFISSLNDRVKCEVKDRGPGISQENAAKLFKKFSQLESSNKRAGSGLGLMICKQIVEAHGGTICCNSELGAGTSFIFEIPKTAQQNEVKSTDKSALSTITKKGGSIRNVFGALLTVFLLTQLAVSATLGVTLNEASSKARDYSREKHTLIKCQQLTSFFMDFRKLVQSAFKKQNFKAFISVYPLLQKQLELTRELSHRSKPNSELKSALDKIDEQLVIMQKEAKDAISQYPDISHEYLEAAFKRGDEIGMILEDLLFRVLDLENRDLDVSYNLGTELRARVISMLAVCAITNIGLIVALTIYTASILKKMSALVSKTHDFASGGCPSADISGNDELSRLDHSFCEVAALVREAETQRQELLSVINHDLRTPLASVLTTIELISSGRFGELDPQNAVALESCEMELSRLLNQLNNLLTLEQAEQGALQPDMARLDLKELLEDLANEYKKVLRQKNSRIEIHAADENSYEIRAELFLLRRAIQALLDNAIQASKENSCIDTTLTRDSGKIILKIEDHANGIAAELQNQIFNRFRSVEGQALAGMGLPLAFRLMNAQAAELRLEASSETGTTFTCTFIES